MPAIPNGERIATRTYPHVMRVVQNNNPHKPSAYKCRWTDDAGLTHEEWFPAGDVFVLASPDARPAPSGIPALCYAFLVAAAVVLAVTNIFAFASLSDVRAAADRSEGRSVRTAVFAEELAKNMESLQEENERILAACRQQYDELVRQGVTPSPKFKQIAEPPATKQK